MGAWVWVYDCTSVSVIVLCRGGKCACKYECVFVGVWVWVYVYVQASMSVLCGGWACKYAEDKCRVGQNHTCIRIHGVHTVILAGKSSYIRSYTVCIYGSGQPYCLTDTGNGMSMDMRNII